MKNNTNFFLLQKSTLKKYIDGVCVCAFLIFLGENAKNQFALLIINHRGEQMAGRRRGGARERENVLAERKNIYSIYIRNARPGRRRQYIILLRNTHI